MSENIIEIERKLIEYAGEDRVISFAQKSKELLEAPKPGIIHCGFFELDRLVGGFSDGELILVSGRPKSGKTLFLQTLTNHFAGIEKKVLWLSYEVPARQFLDSFEELPEAYMPRQMELSNIWWLEQRVYESKLKYGTDVVMIDHLHYLVDMSKLRNASIEIGNIYRRLKLLAIRHQIIIFVISHLRKVEAGAEPQAEDIRDCLPGDQLVYSNGKRIQVNRLKKGQKVVSFGGLHRSLQNDVITDVWSTGQKRIYRLTTKTNRTIDCSDGHKFYASSYGVKDRSGLAGWTEMKNLIVGQRVAVVKKYPTINVSVGQETITEEQACLLGWLIGDGHISPTYFVDATAGSKENADTIKKLADHAFNLHCKIKSYKNKRAYRIYLTTQRRQKGLAKKNNELASFLRRIHFNPVGDKKYVPHIIFAQSNNVISAFLRGLFQADGSSSNVGRKDSCGLSPAVCVHLATISLRLAKDVQHLLLRFGIISYIGKVKRKFSIYEKLKNKRDCSWQVLMRSYNARNFYERIGFLGKKQKHLECVLGSWRRQNLRERDFDLFFDRIKSIEYLGKKETYDISVQGHHTSLTNNSFCVNDFLTHNSNFALGEPDTVLMLWRLMNNAKKDIRNEARLKVEMTRRTGVLKETIRIRKTNSWLEEIDEPDI